MPYRWIVIFLFAAICLHVEMVKNNPVVISLTSTFFHANNPDNPYGIQLSKLMKKNRNIQVWKWGGIKLPGTGSTLMMSLAGGTAPDIGLSWFYTINNDIKQNLLHPLNEWIWEDTNKNGVYLRSESSLGGLLDEIVFMALTPKMLIDVPRILL